MSFLFLNVNKIETMERHITDALYIWIEGNTRYSDSGH